MLVLCIGFVSAMILDKSEMVLFNDTQSKDQLRKSVTHVNEMLAHLESRIESESKNNSQIDYGFNYDYTPPGFLDYEITEIWWPSNQSLATSEPDPTGVPSPQGTLPDTTTEALNQTVVTPAWPFQNTPHPGTSEFVQDLNNAVETNKFGYFTVGLTKFLELVSIKEPQNITPIIYGMEKSIEPLFVGFYLVSSGNLPANLNVFFNWMKSQDPTSLQKRASLGNHILKNKHVLANEEVNGCIDLYDSFFQPNDGVALFGSLEEFYKYPDGGQKATEVSRDMMNAVLTPFLRSNATEDQITLESCAEDVINSLYRDSRARKNETDNLSPVMITTTGVMPSSVIKNETSVQSSIVSEGFVSAMILVKSELVLFNDTQLKDQLRKSLTHVNEMLAQLESRIESESKNNSQIDFGFNYDYTPSGFLDYEITEIWWPTNQSLATSEPDPTVVPSSEVTDDSTVNQTSSTITNYTTRALIPTLVTPAWPLQSTPHPNASKFVQDLINAMETDKFGYFTVGLTKFLKFVAIKDPEHIIYPIIDEMEKSLEPLLFRLNPFVFGQTLQGNLEILFTGMKLLAYTTLQKHAVEGYNILKNKNVLANDGVKYCLDLYDSLFQPNEGLALFASLEAFDKYPNGGQQVSEVSRDMMIAVLAPFLRSNGTEDQITLTTCINEPINSLYRDLRAGKNETNNLNTLIITTTGVVPSSVITNETSVQSSNVSEGN